MEARAGVPMAEVVEVINIAVTDPRGREMVIQYIETPNITVAECGRRISVESRTTACRIWNKALRELRAWYLVTVHGILPIVSVARGLFDPKFLGVARRFCR